MTREEAADLWKKTQAMCEARATCVGPHDFEDLTPRATIGKKWRCRLCGGTCDTVEKGFYEQGLKHARGAP